MKKAVFLIITVVLLTTVFAIGASAEYFINEDFSDGIDCFQDLINHGDEGTIREWVDGAFHGASPASRPVLNQRIFCTETTLPTDLTVSFDYKLAPACTGEKGPVVNVYIGGGSRASLGLKSTFMNANGGKYSELAEEHDVWYTLMLQF